jgi:hypothetical protein
MVRIYFSFKKGVNTSWVLFAAAEAESNRIVEYVTGYEQIGTILNKQFVPNLDKQVVENAIRVIACILLYSARRSLTHVLVTRGTRGLFHGARGFFQPYLGCEAVAGCVRDMRVL